MWPAPSMSMYINMGIYIYIYIYTSHIYIYVCMYAINPQTHATTASIFTSTTQREAILQTSFPCVPSASADRFSEAHTQKTKTHQYVYIYIPPRAGPSDCPPPPASGASPTDSEEEGLVGAAALEDRLLLPLRAALRRDLLEELAVGEADTGLGDLSRGKVTEGDWVKGAVGFSGLGWGLG